MNQKKSYSFYYIYSIQNKTNHKKYIGWHATNNLLDEYFGSGIALNKAIQKYGKENFSKTILEFCSRETILQKEIDWIKKENTKTPNGYNLTDGGDGILGLKMDQKFKEKMRLLKIGSKNPHSEKTKEKMRKKHKKFSLESKEKISEYKKELFKNKINHPRSKIFIIHTPSEKILCVGTFRIFRDKNKSIYNKYFKEVIQKDISINGWYFKEFSSLENIPHIEEYTLFTV